MKSFVQPHCVGQRLAASQQGYVSVSKIIKSFDQTCSTPWLGEPMRGR